MYEDIKEQFSRVIQYSQNIADPKLDNLFLRWEKAKEKFIQRFGGLIYEWPEQIEFTLDEKEKKSRAQQFADIVQNSFGNVALADFIDANSASFFDNKIIDTIDYNIPKGMKLIKAFKYFEKDNKRLRTLQDFASAYVQENKIKGTLCFSVHPLDFLSSSENTYNWRSCHALDGEFCAGNLSYMVDKTTFMVYLKGNQDAKLPSFPEDVLWNSKKWRVLFHAAESDEMMFAGRQYPFSSKSGLDIALNIYNNILGTEFLGYHRKKYGSWQEDYVDAYCPKNGNSDSCISLNGLYLIHCNELLEINQVVKEGRNALNYNDVLRSSCYKYPYYAVLNPYDYHSINDIIQEPIIIGGSVSCLECEKEDIIDNDVMVCGDCRYEMTEEDDYGVCECCGRHISSDECNFIGESLNNIVCDNCLTTECFLCDCCGEYYFNEEKMYVDENRWYCKKCFEIGG